MSKVKVTYVCNRCGTLIGALDLAEWELVELGMDPLTAQWREDIIRDVQTGDMFVYSLCDDCTETMALHESDLPYMRAPDWH